MHLNSLFFKIFLSISTFSGLSLISRSVASGNHVQSVGQIQVHIVASDNFKTQEKVVRMIASTDPGPTSISLTTDFYAMDIENHRDGNGTIILH